MTCLSMPYLQSAYDVSNSVSKTGVPSAGFMSFGCATEGRKSGVPSAGIMP